MPASPHLERFTVDDDGTPVDAVALAHHKLNGHELVLLVPDNAFDEQGDDMDSWVRVAVDIDGQRVLRAPPDALVDEAWTFFEDVLSLTFSGSGETS